MNVWIAVLLLALAGMIGAVWLTGRFRAYALRAEMIDGVNQRGSHSVATPRGGGASIVIVTIAGAAISWWEFGFAPAHAIGLIGGGLAIAGIGWRDDHGHVSPAVRLAAHLAAAIWGVFWIGPLPLAFLPFWDPQWTAAAGVLTVLAVVWMVNLYNFMDGIDGLAASEAAVVATAGSVLIWLHGGGVADVAPPVFLAAACVGFLCWNWPPAKIFMGDTSSGFLGFALAVWAVIAGQISPLLGVAWFVLLGVFVADASVTLVRRLLRRDRVYQAHRSHAYQRLTRRIGSHLPITLGAGAITLLWLFPVAWLISSAIIEPVLGAAVAYLPLVAATFVAGAGRGDD